MNFPDLFYKKILGKYISMSIRRL